VNPVLRCSHGALWSPVRETWEEISSADSGHEVLVYPYGGGFQIRIPREDLRLATPREISPQIEPAWFGLDDCRSFPGFWNPAESWNGWSCPYFTAETMLEFIEEFGIEHPADPQSGIPDCDTVKIDRTTSPDRIGFQPISVGEETYAQEWDFGAILDTTEGAITLYRGPLDGWCFTHYEKAEICGFCHFPLILDPGETYCSGGCSSPEF
jgi:hypothetical protein